MSDKKRLLVLTSTFPRWQGDREPPFVFELARRLTDHYEVMVLAPHAPGSLLAETMAGIDVRRFRYCIPPCETLTYNGGIMANLKKWRLNYLLVPLFIFTELVSLAHWVRKYRVDVIHAHWLIPQGMVAVCARMLCRGPKPVLICTSHGTDLLGLPGRLFAWMKQWTIARIDRVAVVSEAMRARAIELAPSHSVDVIPMGVDLSGRFTPLSSGIRNQHEILFVGRLVEEKGVHHLIAAMTEVVRHHPRAMLTIAGDGPDRGRLETLAHDLGLAGKVDFAGALDNEVLPLLYGRATVFVLPSLQEGLGLTLIEALGCECPVVVSDLPSVRDVVVDGVTGLVCRCGDEGDIAQKIIDLLGHPDKRTALAQAGRMRVMERYGWETVVSRYRHLFDQLTSTS